MQRMVMFTSDDAAVMLGKQNGVGKLLQNFIPHLVEQHCVTHRNTWASTKHGKKNPLWKTLKSW